MSMKSLEDLIEYRRSQESPEERAARIKAMKERMAETDKRCHKIFQDSIPSEELLNRMITI